MMEQATGVSWPLKNKEKIKHVQSINIIKTVNTILYIHMWVGGVSKQ